VGRGILQNGVDFSADQNRDAAQIEPEHQTDQRTEGPVEHTEMTEVTNVQLEQRPPVSCDRYWCRQRAAVEPLRVEFFEDGLSTLSVISLHVSSV
jgi:hypothetical protein